VLDGAPGRDVTIARRKGDGWFVGSITNNDARRIQLRFDFLPKGKRYEATIYADDPAAPTRTKVGIRTRTVDSSTVLQLDLAASGGQALWLRPL
jgi:alpha-glucosidase